MMNYVSTRGAMQPASFSEILLQGLAPDGGLAMPSAYPHISVADLARWRPLGYAELAYEILHSFAPELPSDELRTLVHRTYRRDVFGSDAITPLVPMTEGIALLELSNGPTLAFKDIAMQLLGNLFEQALARTGGTLNILGATSGDTGSAAEYAMRGKRGIRVFMLSPLGKMSPFQTAQMFSLTDPNIYNIALRGVFDDAQDLVKAVGADQRFKHAHQIGTVNSINWARVAAQVVYYFKAYFAATRNESDEVSFAVPSGNFGNICAGHIARMMGLPVRRLVCATNENDVLHEFFTSGTYRVRSASETHATSSPSMDISKASNFERFVFDLFDGDSDRVCALWRQLAETGGFDIGQTAEFRGLLQRFGLVSSSSSHAQRLASIQDVYARTQRMIDPHTADGFRGAQQHLEEGIPMILLETAQPAKFRDTMLAAIGIEPSRPRALDGIESMPQRFEVMDADLGQLQDYLQRHIG